MKCPANFHFFLFTILLKFSFGSTLYAGIVIEFTTKVSCYDVTNNIDATFNQYYIEVDITDLGTATSVDVTIGTQVVQGLGIGAHYIGPFNFIDGKTIQQVLVTDVSNMNNNSTSEIQERLCGYTPSDQILHNSGYFCNDQHTVDAPAILAQASPHISRQGDVINTLPVYILVDDLTGLVLARNSSGLFDENDGVISDGNSYTVHSFFVITSEVSVFLGDPGIQLGVPYLFPTVDVCFDYLGNVSYIPDCCPKVTELTASSPICAEESIDDLTVSLADFFESENGQANFSVEIFYSINQLTTAQDVYSNTSNIISTVPISSSGVTSVSVNSFSLPNSTISPIIYYIYARISNNILPLDADCRPFGETVITVNPIPLVMSSCADNSGNLVLEVTPFTDDYLITGDFTGTIMNGSGTIAMGLNAPSPFTINVESVQTGCSTEFMGEITSSCVLPVELISFRATSEDKGILLKWVTASEINSDFFLIEKSQDGRIFSELWKLPAAGTSFKNLNYSYLDQNPFEGDNYYRLKQVDRDHQYEYSPILISRYNKEKNTVLIYPQPVADKLIIEANKPLVQIDLMDQTGKYIIQREVQFNQKVELDMRNLPKGLYFMKIETIEESQFQKIVKQ